MSRLLLVHHTPSPALHAMFTAAIEGASDPELEGVELVRRPALSASAPDVLEADGYLLGTPANIGYMSGALKHFFDTVYYPCLDATRGRPFGCYVHGNEGTEGAERAIASVTKALGWEQVAAPVVVMGTPSKADLAACTELGGVLAATLMG